MNILIYTLPPHANYGGIMQAWALQTVLKRMGHNVKILSFDYSSQVHKVPLRLMVHAIGNWMLHRSDRGEKVFNEMRQERLRRKGGVMSEIDMNLKKFKELHYCWEKRSPQQILPTDYDAIVVGSDQIWHPGYGPYPIEDSFLKFTESWDKIRDNALIRISYAASFGTSSWEYTQEQTENIRDLAKKFNAMSVREEDGLSLCKEYLGVSAKHVLDPTLLLDSRDYCNLIKDVPSSGEYIMAYILDRSVEKEMFVEKVSTLLYKPVKYTGAKIGDMKAPLHERIQPPIEDWLCGFRDAKFVITDSFHGTIFSIIFNKPFITIGNKSRGMSRFYSLFTSIRITKTFHRGIS